MTSTTIPASLDGAVTRLEGIESLLTAKGWERAAIVAAFVRLGQQTHSGPTGSKPATCSACDEGRAHGTVEFGNHGIAGLKSEHTVRLYVRRWLDAHDGVYPEPGATVELPDAPWKETRTGTDGHSSEAGMIKTVSEIVEEHGAKATIAAVTADPKSLHAAIKADPVVAKAAMEALVEDEKTRVETARAIGDANAAKGRSLRTTTASPIVRPATIFTGVMITSLITHAISDIRDALKETSEITPLSGSDAAAVISELERLESLTAMLKAWFSGGTSEIDWDAEIAKITADGA